MLLLGIRISRKYVLYAGMFMIALFLIDQLYLYLQMTSGGTNFSLSLHVDDVRQLVRAGRDTGVDVILFDPVILKAWSSNADMSSPGTCIFLCHVIGPLVFAITQTQLSDKVGKIMLYKLYLLIAN